MLFSIISGIVNVVFVLILNLDMYTDRAPMPNSEVRVRHRSPMSKLHIANQDWLLYLQIIVVAISVISSILFMFGVKSSIIRKVRLISTVASAGMFIIIMIVTANSNVRYT